MIKIYQIAQHWHHHHQLPPGFRTHELENHNDSDVETSKIIKSRTQKEEKKEQKSSRSNIEQEDKHSESTTTLSPTTSILDNHYLEKKKDLKEVIYLQIVDWCRAFRS